MACPEAGRGEGRTSRSPEGTPREAMEEYCMAGTGLKELAETRAPKFGHFVVEFATPGIGHILKSAGCDFVLFDLEHSGFHFETVKSVVRYFEAAGLPAIIRVPSRDYQHIARAMDMGAEGLMLPMVGTVAEAREIVRSMKYHPAGGRGVALQVAHDAYRPGSVADKFAAANRRSTLFCQIETAEGVENAEAMAALDGVDALWVGHFDLSVSLGIPGQFDHPEFKRAIERTIAACRKHNKALGRLVPDVATGIALYGQGFDFICYSGDVWVLHNALAEAIGQLREGTRGGAEAAAAASTAPGKPAQGRQASQGRQAPRPASPRPASLPRPARSPRPPRRQPREGGAEPWPIASAWRSPATSASRTALPSSPISTSPRSTSTPGVEMAFLENAESRSGASSSRTSTR